MQGPFGLAHIIGDSPQMDYVRAQLRRVAPTHASVLLIGGCGTGKELAARAVHAHSARASGPFIALNCATTATNQIETELFGHPGGARPAHAGVFERAHGGTLFLEEVANLPGDVQVRVLRVLESGRLMRVGGTSEFQVDVRVIAATDQGLEQALSEGRLREDLLYRLAVFSIQLPPLRERGADLEQLAEHFLVELNAATGDSKNFSSESFRTLRRHSWPGNVRELRNAVERAYLRSDELIEMEPLGAKAPPAARMSHSNNSSIEVGSKLKDAERWLIEATLEHFDGHKTQAAVALGCSLKTLYNKLNGYTRAAAVIHS